MKSWQVMALCGVLGAATVVGTLRWKDRGVTPEGKAPVPAGATEEYGERLMARTVEYLGPDVADAKMRYTRSRMSCGACHLGTGKEPGTLGLGPAASHYPRFSGRAGASTTVEDRVNECMQRSLNGRPLPMDSVEMMAMARYIRSLGERDAASGASRLKPQEPKGFQTPNRAASPAAGKQVFVERCAACHGANGEGLRASTNPVNGYSIPPLWGEDSFNNGAGMNRILTASKFIKARMPLGQPDLTDDQAYDVAAYIGTQPRPQMAGLEKDYPDRSTKQVDTIYGPYADDFPQEQHRFGPFAPIEAYYKALKKNKKK